MKNLQIGQKTGCLKVFIQAPNPKSFFEDKEANFKGFSRG